MVALFQRTEEIKFVQIAKSYMETRWKKTLCRKFGNEKSTNIKCNSTYTECSPTKEWIGKKRKIPDLFFSLNRRWVYLFTNLIYYTYILLFHMSVITWNLFAENVILDAKWTTFTWRHFFFYLLFAFHSIILLKWSVHLCGLVTFESCTSLAEYQVRPGFYLSVHNLCSQVNDVNTHCRFLSLSLHFLSSTLTLWPFASHKINIEFFLTFFSTHIQAVTFLPMSINICFPYSPKRSKIPKPRNLRFHFINQIEVLSKIPSSYYQLTKISYSSRVWTEIVLCFCVIYG